MTEAEWLESPDALAMLRFLGKKASGRKLRLFAVACARRIWSRFTDERSSRAVSLAEKYADRQVARQELRAAEKEARAAAHAVAGEMNFDANYAALVATETAAYTSPRAAYEAAYFAESINTSGTHRAELRSIHAELLRDIFGNPLRPAILDPAHRTPTVVSLARATYDERHLPSGELDPDRLAVLADALEEVGAPGELMAHLRWPGPHYRGCWALDLVLGLS